MRRLIGARAGGGSVPKAEVAVIRLNTAEQTFIYPGLKHYFKAVAAPLSLPLLFASIGSLCGIFAYSMRRKFL